MGVTRPGLFWASVAILLSLWACVLLAYLMRPVRLEPAGPAVLPVARWDSTAGGHCTIRYIPVRLDR